MIILEKKNNTLRNKKSHIFDCTKTNMEIILFYDTFTILENIEKLTIEQIEKLYADSVKMEV